MGNLPKRAQWGDDNHASDPCGLIPEPIFQHQINSSGFSLVNNKHLFLKNFFQVLFHEIKNKLQEKNCKKHKRVEAKQYVAKQSVDH